MRVERTMMAADVTVGLTSHRSPSAGTATAAAATAATPTAGVTGRANTGQTGAPVPAEAIERAAESRPAPTMPGLSATDRAAIASATGFYITAGGKVTPDGMPPWGFIVRYVEQRQSERTSDPHAGVDPVEGTAPVIESEHVDVTV